MRAAVDSSILLHLLDTSFALKEPVRAARLAALLEGKRHDIVVPTVALAEVLVQLPAADVRRADLLDFDGKAATFAAQVSAQPKGKAAKGKTRRCVKADAFIAATAHANRVLLLTGDGNQMKLMEALGGKAEYLPNE